VRIYEVFKNFSVTPDFLQRSATLTRIWVNLPMLI
jgi:hypothetical protein